ncbi:dTMP kinase [Hippea alviniae]|uniref:dTMP kinase n=1 Tax=Hippea alviniae TaxID=1279027 RepID=UPI0003B684B5|nr:dTMP kinase [Hippea alviniae]
MHQRSQKSSFRYIAFEGIDGSGKTTQAKLFVEFLKREGKSVFFVREPYNEKLRNILLNENFNDKAKLFMFLADRSELADLIFEKLKESIVVSDRSFFSTLAYQGYGDKMDVEFLFELNMFALEGLKPDVVFCIDIPVEIMHKRIKSRDFIESKGDDFFRRVRDGYLGLGKFCENYFIVDGSRSENMVFEEIVGIWKGLIGSQALS